MGNTIDISHTILGNSLINKKFITKVPFYYRMYIDGSEYFSHTHFFLKNMRYSIQEWYLKLIKWRENGESMLVSL